MEKLVYVDVLQRDSVILSGVALRYFFEEQLQLFSVIFGFTNVVWHKKGSMSATT